MDSGASVRQSANNSHSLLRTSRAQVKHDDVAPYVHMLPAPPGTRRARRNSAIDARLWWGRCLSKAGTKCFGRQHTSEPFLHFALRTMYGVRAVFQPPWRQEPLSLGGCLGRNYCAIVTCEVVDRKTILTDLSKHTRATGRDGKIHAEYAETVYSNL